jgi:hypothetical protein
VKLSEIKINERYALYLENGRGIQPVQVLAIGVPYEGGKHAHGVLIRSEDNRHYIVHYRRITVQWDEWELSQSIAKYERDKFDESLDKLVGTFTPRWPIEPGDEPIKPVPVHMSEEAWRFLQQWFPELPDWKPPEPPEEV